MHGLHLAVTYNEHLKVEEHLSNDPAGVGAVLIDYNRVNRHAPAVEAARNAGVDVRIDPKSYELITKAAIDQVNYFHAEPLDPLTLQSHERAELVDIVVGLQESASVLTPPYFYAPGGDARHAFEDVVDLNVSLMRRTAGLGDERPVVPILALARVGGGEDGPGWARIPVAGMRRHHRRAPTEPPQQGQRAHCCPERPEDLGPTQRRGA